MSEQRWVRLDKVMLGSGFIKKMFNWIRVNEVLDNHLKYKIHKDLTLKGMRTLKRLLVKFGEMRCLQNPIFGIYNSGQDDLDHNLKPYVAGFVSCTYSI